MSMTVKQQKRPKPNRPSPSWPWKRDMRSYEKKMGRWRIKEDRKHLAEIFRHAARAPEAQAAMEWAEKHDVAYIVDYSTTTGGYYTIGTGVVAISGAAVERAVLDNMPHTAIRTLTHEIAHARQDYYGLIAVLGRNLPFHDFYIRQALIEADATARGNLAEEQYIMQQLWHFHRTCVASPLKDTIKDSTQKKELELAQPEKFLWEEFASWYQIYADYYGKNTVGYYGAMLKIPGVSKPDLKAEFAPRNRRRMHPGLDPSRREDLMLLGKAFKGGTNYFRAAEWDQLQRQMLAPALCHKFFDASLDRPQEHVETIRKAQLKQRFKIKR